MDALKQSIAFFVGGCLIAAMLTYVNVYYFVEIDESYKVRTPSALWKFQFNIWWPIILVMGVIFGGASWSAKLWLKSSNISSHWFYGAIAAFMSIVLLFFISVLLQNRIAFLIVAIAGPVSTAAIITRLCQVISVTCDE